MKLSLPVIPESWVQDATVFVRQNKGLHPYIRGSGDIDLLCGSCALVLVESVQTGQIENLVLKCPSCASFNVIVEVPRVEQFVKQLLATDANDTTIPKFRKILIEGLTNEAPANFVAEQVAAEIPELDWFENYLVPDNAGETYAMLAFVLALVTWYQTRRKTTRESPKTIINNFFSGDDPFRGIGRNDICPCGSGKKFKKCHGGPEGE